MAKTLEQVFNEHPEFGMSYADWGPSQPRIAEAEAAFARLTPDQQEQAILPLVQYNGSWGGNDALINAVNQGTDPVAAVQGVASNAKQKLAQAQNQYNDASSFGASFKMGLPFMAAFAGGALAGGAFGGLGSGGLDLAAGMEGSAPGAWAGGGGATATGVGGAVDLTNNILTKPLGGSNNMSWLDELTGYDTGLNDVGGVTDTGYVPGNTASGNFGIDPNQVMGDFVLPDGVTAPAGGIQQQLVDKLGWETASKIPGFSTIKDGASLLNTLKGMTGPSGGLSTGNSTLDALMRGLPGAIGALGANSQAGALTDLANKQWGAGEGARTAFNATLQPGFTMNNDPGFTDMMNQASKANLYGLSTKGNPALNPTAQSQNMNDLFARQAYPALQQYRSTMSSAGGLPQIAAGAPGATTNAIGAQGNVLSGLGAAAGDIFNPKTNLLEQLLAAQQGGNMGLYKLGN